ncbi:MlaC/ttg2D family ABC transporter substrate-binding protein [Ghiorsea bivora]|uniref:MlaC/ttg2D family ABC transporter substrate-binding protein n=1 Tax=Ghiorsea bivora TaxID=1485545 RepID=UPI0012FE1EDE|nr:ABC transporter substrate-binding protein [Ghiorsea bivora]
MRKMILVWVMVCVMPALGLTNEDDPKTVVASTIQSIIDVLEARADKDSISDEDRENIRKVVAGKFDYREMSRRSVGKPWKKMTAEKQTEFTELFRQVLEYSYGNQLAGYHGQKVVFEKADFKKDKARVKGAVIDDNKTIPMEYRLHQTPTGWQVYDIKIEGVSMITTFRKDFKSIIKKKDVDGLMLTLQQKIDKLKAKG